ncbi:MAG: 2'-5' RNA ligase family protein [Acidimicrobiia bacterium]|nr:2'-5' RNA ligase family protein [Acidimicrobiia bacterium]NNC75892.1 2'-5' RNA ligase family protein [Acidimicrobiia bacterium]
MRAEHDPAAVVGIPAHITVLYPFMTGRPITPGVIDDLSALLAPRPSFEFDLVDVDSFDDTLFLVPEPAEPFADLTNVLHDHWPEYPPYEGAFPDLVPHLTVAHGDGATFEWMTPELEAGLPIHCVADTVMLFTEGDDAWGSSGRFSLV